jgi:hypothetical protein
MVHLAPGRRLVPQVLLSAKSAAFVPMSLMLLIVNRLPLGFLTVIVWEALDVPTF